MLKEYTIEIAGNSRTAKIRLTFQKEVLSAVGFADGQDISHTMSQFVFSLFFKYGTALNDLLAFFKKKGWKVAEIPVELTFEVFWNAYGNKVGNKARCEKLWATLTEEDKALCLQSIRAYRFYLANNTTQRQAYPETYLAQRRFENEYAV